MVDIKRKFGERIAVRRQGYIQIINIMPEFVILRLSTEDIAPERVSDLVNQDGDVQFRCSE